MDSKKSKELVVLVNYFVKNYFYSPIYVKGAEEAIFLLGSSDQKFQLIIITTINMTDYLERKKMMNKIDLVIKKLDTKPKSILVLSYNNKHYFGKENNIEIAHIFDNNIPDIVNDWFPSLQDVELFDEYLEKLKDQEIEEREKNKEKNKIDDTSNIFKMSKESFTKNPLPLSSKKQSLITKNTIRQNTFTKGLLIFTLLITLGFQFLLSVPIGSQDSVKIVAFGGIYSPFVFGYNGIWRLFSYIFVSNSIFTFIFVAIAFYFFSRMSETFYGGIRYLIILCVGSVLTGLVVSQIFPNSIFYGLAIPMWLFIGTTGTFLVSKWRNISKSIKIRYFLYFFLILMMFLFLGSFGGRIEAGLIAFLIGIVLGMCAQFKVSNFKMTWKKSINPLIALSCLLLTAIIIPLVNKRSQPLNSPHLNQGVFVTYEKYKMIKGSAKTEFTKMNQDFYKVIPEKSSCLWNLNILYDPKNFALSKKEKDLISQVITNIDVAYVNLEVLVVQNALSKFSTLIAQIDENTYKEIYDKAILWKDNYLEYSKNYENDKYLVFKTKYDELLLLLKNKVLTPQIQINLTRVNDIFTMITLWKSISLDKTKLFLSKNLETFSSTPNRVNQDSVKSEFVTIQMSLKNDSFKQIDSSSFFSTLNDEVGSLNNWCFISIL